MQTDFSPEHLPAWMRQPHRSFDWGILLAAALGLIAAWAFVIRPGVPAYSDLLHSGFMATDLADALREGQLFPRWSPHVLGGYGAPIPTFLPQGAPFIVAVLDQLLTGDIASALRLVLISAMILAAVGQYLFCKRWMSPTAALMSAALYVFSPVLGLTASHIAGDLAATLAMAVLPILMWSAMRAASNASAWDVLISTLLMTALLYLNPVMALAGIALVIILGIFNGQAAIIRIVVVITAASSLFAPFWLPALAMMPQVEWRSTGGLERTIISFSTLIEPVNAIDPVMLNPVSQYTLGAVLPIFALAGLLWMVVTRRSQRFIVIFVLTATASALHAVITGASWPTYILTFSAASIGGAALEWRAYLPLLLRRVALSAALLLLVISSQTVWLSPFGPSINSFSPLEQIEYERNGFGIAVLPAEVSVPFTTRAGLATESNLIESYFSPPLTRIQPGTPARVTAISSDTHSHAWQVSSTTRTPLTISLAYFPNWSASLDGQALTVERNLSGLVSLSLPQTTNGTLRLTVDALPEDVLAWAVALTAVIGLLIWVRFRTPGESQSVPMLNIQEARLTGFAVIAMGIALMSVAVPDGRFHLRPESFSSLRDTLPLTVTSDPLRLLAYKFNTTRPRPGEVLPVTLYWTALQPTETNYRVRLVLIDIDRQIRYPLTSLHAPGSLPTGRWLAGYMVQDPYVLEIPEDLTAGTYQLSAELYPCDAGCDLRRPLRFLDSQGIERPSITFPTVLTVGG